MIKVSSLLLVYATLLLIGGLVGYAQSGSVMSLVSASIATILTDVSAIGLKKRWPYSFFLSCAVTGMMTIFFGYRFYMTSKLMPGGVFALVSLAMFCVLLYHRRNPR